VKRQLLRFVRHRFRTTFRRRWGGYLALVLLIGVMGGIAMGSIAAGRRTQSSYPRFLASTSPSDLNVPTFPAGGGNGSAPSPSPAGLTNAIGHLPGVKRVESDVSLNIDPLGPDGAPKADVFNSVNQVATLGSVDGLFFNQDRVTVIHGRMADPSQVDEVMMTAGAAGMLGAHVGQVVPMGEYTSAQLNLPDFGTPSVTPNFRFGAKLVGIVILNNHVVQDDIDRVPDFAVFTPALTRKVLADRHDTTYGLQLEHGGHDVAGIEQALLRTLPRGTSYQLHAISRVEAQVERAVRPEAIALSAFGAIAALAAMLITAQAIARQLRGGEDDLQVLRALGAGPLMTVSEGLIGTLGAVVIGSLLAGAVAVGLSPLAPLGPVRPVYPASGVAFDWTVLGVGLVVLVGGLGVISVVLAYLVAPHRVARRAGLVATRDSSVARIAAYAGLSPPAVVGVRFALEPGQGRSAVPVRSALMGAAVAVVTVVATLTFGSGLRTLVSHPAVYGWNWNYLLNSDGNSVPPPALALLGHDPDVAAWTGVTDLNVQMDGQTVPILDSDPRPALSAPILSGHGLHGEGQVVLGVATMAQLRKHIGDSVTVRFGTGPQARPFRLQVVGTATLPAVGFPSYIADHPEMGTGGLVSAPAVVKTHSTLDPDPNNNGPQLVFVRFRHGVRATAGRADIQRIADAGSKVLSADPNAMGGHVAVLGVQHPAEIVNYRSMGAAPILLASGLAAGAVAGLGLTLAASVRRRRRDLALLKTLGFTKRQLAAAVAWQATVAAVVGLVVGVPVGIALGRQLWILFARNINAVPEPSVPVLSLIIAALGALVFANVVAAVPGRTAARTPTSMLLQAE
jgi:hypothetical protein